MERGLLWLPLLMIFIVLAWNGWNEYQKVEMYRQWAEAFDRAKYDIYAVLGQKERRITWGKPTREGVIAVQTFLLDEVRAINLLVNDRPVDLDALPSRGTASIEFILADRSSQKVPFTEIPLASQWTRALRQLLG